MSIFTISGLRGIVGTDLPVAQLQQAGNAFGMLIRGGTCAVGRDTRNSADMTFDSVVSGLLYRGCRVLDLGVTSTPSVFRSVRSMNLDGGISITSSHNPPEWHGAKFIVPPGRGILQNELNTLLQYDGGFEGRGIVTRVDSSYSSDMIEFLTANSCTDLKLAIDLGGGAGCVLVEHVLKELGCRVTSLNSSPGIFSRVIDPTTSKLDSLSIEIKRSSYHAGFAFDADADRLVIMDSGGVRLSPDYTLLAGLKYLHHVETIDKVAISVDTSLSVVKFLDDIGVKIINTGVGEVNVVSQIMKNNCDAGGEGSSGGFIYPSFNLCRDGLLVATMISRMIKELGSLEAIFAGTKKYAQQRVSIPCERSIYGGVMEAISSTEPDAETIDGVKICPSDESWVLIRPSNTESGIRISAEAKSKDDAITLASTYEKKIREILERDF